MQLFLLGYAANNDVRNIPLAVYDQCHCAESRALLDAYRSADYFRLLTWWILRSRSGS
jgi:ABC-2 type transport system permease protein